MRNHSISIESLAKCLLAATAIGCVVWLPLAEADDTQRESKESAQRVSLAAAKDRAKVLHAVYLSTLDVMHRQYFHGDRAVVPARALEDVFRDMKREQNIEAKWISVNVRAMSIDHKPETAFEKRAAGEIAKGKESIETVEDGFYRRAGRVSLGGGCIGCHEGFSLNRSTSRKFAGLVISIPVTKD